MHLIRRFWWLGLVLVLAVAPAGAQVIELEPPEEGQFVLDLAEMVRAEDEAAIRERCAALLSDTAIPLIVVTVRAMSAHGAPNLRIETFATLLFDQWGIGHEEVGGRSFNRGILLLVSEQDRRARIELGADWGREHDEIAQRIMDDHIITHFRQGDFSGGIRAGVKELDNMARGERVSGPPVPWWQHLILPGFIALAIFTAISLVRSGASGWAWVLWAAVFGILGYILYSALMNSARGGMGGGGFSGGSFGGGFSGGGGATGSW